MGRIQGLGTSFSQREYSQANRTAYIPRVSSLTSAGALTRGMV